MEKSQTKKDKLIESLILLISSKMDVSQENKNFIMETFAFTITILIMWAENFICFNKMVTALLIRMNIGVSYKIISVRGQIPVTNFCHVIKNYLTFC